jgi:hypothetical protein
LRNSDGSGFLKFLSAGLNSLSNNLGNMVAEVSSISSDESHLGPNSEQRCKSSKVLDLKAVKSSQRKYKYVLKYIYFEV